MKVQNNIDQPNYSSFDLSHLHRTTMDMGQLVPVSVIPTLPGDIIKTDVQAFVRGMPTIAPIIDKVDIKVNHFYVPYRILWDGFTDWLTMDNTHQSQGEAKPEFPKVALPSGLTGSYPFGRLADYLGIGKASVGQVSLMPFLAYNRIFLDYYAPSRWVQYLRQNNQAHPLAALDRKLVQIKKQNTYLSNYSSTGTDANLFSLKQVGWNHDYFTNALPTPQLFDQVSIPLIKNEIPANDKYFYVQAGGASGNLLATETGTFGALNKAQTATIRNLRENIALQHFLEKMQIGGGRYIETLKTIWGQDVPNNTLQRPEYLGGSTIPLFVNEVESTADTSTASLGDLAGKPIGAGKFDDINFKCDEHGIYMCIAHISPKRSYTDVIEKNIWLIDDVFDLPQPDFENIGDEAVYRFELSGEFLNQTSVFGYVPRYSNWKGKIDRYSGELKSSLLHWHLGETSQKLAQYTEISPEFIDCVPREDIFNVANEPDKFIASFQFNVYAKRKLQNNPRIGLTRI